MSPRRLRALIARALAPRPAWIIRAIVRTGRGQTARAVAEYYGTLQVGYARDEIEAVQKYRHLNPTLPPGLELRAFRKGDPV